MAIKLSRVFLVLTFFLSGCSIIKPPEPLDMMTLRTQQEGMFQCGSPTPLQVVVGMPDASGGLRSDRIAILFDEREIRYLAGARWEAPAPVLIQRHLVYYLNATHCFKGVGTEGAGLASRYRLTTDMQRFHLCYYSEDSVPYAEILLRVSILDAEKGQILESKIITFKKKSAGTNQSELMDALDNVVSLAMQDASRWAATVLRAQ
ncbi:ABC-type transport auxiliary lipoprotein family protein [Desulfosarcina sp. OttesenSCG-928-A07]|nr:ABC-type transport auxiliary lipoprotein family protein [Desulfosarcina sp. OttesenSCG-928-A07]